MKREHKDMEVQKMMKAKAKAGMSESDNGSDIPSNGDSCCERTLYDLALPRNFIQAYSHIF